MDLTKIMGQIRTAYDKTSTTIIGIDGLGGAGKSTISEELLRQYGREFHIVVLHIDDFIHPKAVRYHDGYAEWKCYYDLQWRYDYLLHEIIQPVKRGEYFHKKIERYDKENDTYILKETEIPVGSLVVIEGVFLQREELRGVFDYMIYMDVPEETRLDRVLKRDGYIGNAQEIRNKYNNRYFPAEHYYVEKYQPAQHADFVIKK